MMTVIYIVFGILFGLVILAAIGLGSANLVVHNKRKKLRDETAARVETEEVVSENVLVRICGARVEVETLPEEEAEQEEPSEEVTSEEGTFLPKAEKLSFREKYDRLSPEIRSLLDEFGAYIRKQADCEQLEQAGAIAFRYHKGQIAKAVIRRDAVILNFAIVNPDLGRMAREERAGGIKLKPVEIRLEDKDALAIAETTADITIGYLKQEEEYRAEKRREARREAAKKKREEAAVAKD